ncbi:thioredoxin family protein [Aliarcobacter butzleri]|jgi:small redox-active disulfide protein 2|uniref:Thioredoxin family protein n=1 Tax=Aliarcobacter butzleri TaxID=28197 RepID=A0AAW7Q1L8_9BACT|nr:thioredoxin family protein [Aliarcobacter butzleri]AGR78120.1 redox-active disulfide protein 2 [Aliarcobacter butzleri 7h1h]KLE05294.1 redox-active disulfide protein [Aliarcobacter butzleri L353]KLE11816.1 redox-active disulfide protein [Aliarcobacter butzleri L354]MCG3654523.1 thioredoxin family protein [Aliarcobacter butzleri]MCG3668409.1 thioredoxin family protein [Aliarcobacter butzleri]
MKIEILGTGCTKCKNLEENTKQAVAKIGGFHEIKKVEDIVEIMNYSVMSTPALVVDGVVKSTGKVLSVDELLILFKGI